MTAYHMRRDWMIALAFIVLIPSLVGLWYVDHRREVELRKAQAHDAWERFDNSIAACARGNVLREATNDQSDVLHEIGVRYALSDDLLAKLHPIPLVDCFLVIKKPLVERP